MISRRHHYQPRPSRKRRQAGFGLIEIAVGAAIIAIALVGSIIAFQSVTELEQKNTRMIQAAFLTEEALEAMRALRQDNWANLSSLELETDYWLSLAAGAWTLSTDPFLIDGLFDRRIKISAVNRDIDGRIAETGTLDPGTVKVAVNLAWNDRGATTTKTAATYLTDIFSD